MTFTGAVTLNSGAVWNEPATGNGANNTYTFANSFTNNATTFNALGTGVHTFSGAAMTLGGATVTSIGSVSITGTYTNNGTLTARTALAGTGTLTNTGTLNIGGTSTITGLTATTGGNIVNYTGTGQTIKATAYDTLNVTGTATNSGTVTAAAALGGTGTLTNTGTLNIGGTSTITGLTATTGGNIVNYTGAAQIIKATAYDTLNVTGTATNSGTVTAATALGGTGTLTNDATGILNIGGTSLITTLNASTVGNVVNYTGAAAQTINPTTYATLNFSGAGVKTNSGIVTVNTALTGTAMTNAATGTLNIGGTSTITTLTATAAGNIVNYTGAAQIIKATAYDTLNVTGTATNSGTVTAATALGGTGTLTNDATGILNIGGTSLITTLNASTVGNIVNYTGAGAQTIKATTYATLNFSGAGVKTNSGIVTVNTALTGTAMTNAATGTLNIGGTSTITTLTATAVGNTVNYTGAGQTVKATTYHHLGLGGSGAKAMGATAINGDFTLSGTATTAPTGALTVGGNFTIGVGTTFTAGALAHSVGGNWDNSGTFTAGTSTVTFNGAAQQTLTGATTFNNLTVNNATGITINNDVTVGTLLTLTSGAVTTGANILGTSASANCPASIARTGGFVNGNLRLTFPTGTTTCTYHVGSGGNYAPIGVTMVASTGGTLTGSTTGNEHPQISSSGIDSTLDVNRYWTLWASGDTVVATSYGATFNFVAGDVDALATTGNFVVGKYASSAWTLPTPVTATATSTGVSNVAGPINSVTDFVAGEKVFVCSVPSDLPANMSCECDNFNRINVNPSPIFGNGSYTLTQSSGTAGWPKIANGHLQMTDNSGNMSTSATVPGTFPAAGNLISLEFRHYAYKTGGVIGADGIGVTLSDAAITPLAGAFGGSLGYAQKTGINGFAGGWIGIGIDEYGNYQSSTEGRVGGACGMAGCLPESVGVRGSGSGVAGYPFLGGTATLSPVIDNTASATPAPGYAYRVQVDARCYQNNTANYTGNFAINCATANPSAAKWAKVRVYRDTTGLGNFGTPLTNLDFEAYAAAIAAIPSAIQADVPANWKLSYTGSTGGSVNFHEIGALKICAQTITPPAGYRILVDNLTPTTCPSDPQPTVTISALDTNGNPVTTYNKTVNLSATLQGGGASSATWTPYPSNLGTWDGVNKRYTFVAGDNGVAKFYLSDLIQENVYITVSEYLGTINTSLATPVQYSSGAASFVVNIPDTLGSVVVAGRAHLMSITRNKATCGGGTDTTYTGVKPLDGWYDPAVGDHPTGAAAPQICLPNAGVCLPSYGACQTLSIAAPALSASSNNLNLTFASGVANFCLVTSDVGKYALGLRDDTTVPASPVTGASAILTARPFAVVVSDVKQGATNNPANNTSGGSVFAKAGTAFQATVAGYLWNSAGDTGSNGLPGAAAVWSAITSAGIAPSYADTVTLAAGAPFTPAAGILSNGSVAVTAGSTIATTLSYNEVGSFTLTATPATSYLNSGINLSNRVAIFSNPASASQNGLVGRFIPDHLGFSGTLQTRSDLLPATGSTFTYMDEPMKLTLTVKAYAYSSSEVSEITSVKTMNYTGLFAKLDAATLGTSANWFNTGCTGSTQCMGLGAVNGTTIGLSNRLAIDTTSTGSSAPSNTAWSNGSSDFTAYVKFSRQTSPLDGPFQTLKLGGMPRDSDGVTLPGQASGDATHRVDLDATTGNTLASNPDGTNERRFIFATDVRFGRLHLLNAYGSELLPMLVDAYAEYWDGTRWVLNTVDALTAIPQNGVTASGGIAANTCFLTNPPPSAPTNASCLAAGSPITTFNGVLGRWVVFDRTTPQVGITDLSINLTAMPWLRGFWSSAGTGYIENPTARLKFGSPKAPYIYLRERY